MNIHNDHLASRAWIILSISTLFSIPCNSPAQIALDGTLGPAGPLAGPDYAVTADLGTQAGNNLFHSFTAFNLNNGESATFSGPANIANILARVTGGFPSAIDGTLRSTIAGANLIFINPAGVIFGPNAALDITGSFTVTTADTLHLADSGQFHATDPDQSLLTTAAPSAFGFLNNAPAPITINESSLGVTPGHSIKLIAGNIQLTGPDSPVNNPTLHAPNGTVEIASVASTGDVLTTSINDPYLDASGIPTLGNVDLSRNASLVVDGDPAGTVVIRANQLNLSNSSLINAGSTGSADHEGDAIDVYVSQFSMDVSSVTASSLGSGRGGNILLNTIGLTMNGQGIGTQIESHAVGAGNAGDITITTDELLLQNAAGIESTSFGPGDGAQIMITADQTILDGMGFVTVFMPDIIGTGISGITVGPGKGADIHLQTNTLTILRGAVITAASLGTNDAGSIEITAQELLIDGVDYLPPSVMHGTGIGSPTFLPADAGDAGDITVTASNLTLTRGGQITSNSFGDGSGGDIHLDADGFLADREGSPTITGVLAEAHGTGPGGDIMFGTPEQPAGLIQIREGATISTLSTNTGSAGDILLYADRLEGDGQGFIPIRSEAHVTGIAASTISMLHGGRGGNVEIHTSSITLDDRAEIVAETFFDGGNSGNILIRSPEIDVLNKSTISATTFSAGMGGNIDITADRILLDGGGEPLDAPGFGMPFGPDILLPRPDGQTDILTGQANTAIVAASFNAGDAGNVNIRANSLVIRDVASIAVGSFGIGAGGSATIDAGTITVSRGDTRFASGIFATALFLGRVGSLDIRADDIQISDGGLISADSFGPSPGGDVNIVTGSLSMSNMPSGRLSLLASQTHGADPNATGGNLTISAGSVLVDEGALISAASFGAGSGGNVVLSAESLAVTNIGAVQSIGTGTGSAGELTITVAGSASLQRGGSLASGSAQSDAGLISLTVGNNLNMYDGRITAQAQGNGGNVQISVANLARLVDSLISAEATGDGGNILINPTVITLDNTEIIANAVEGNGGDISLQAAVFLVTPSSLISASSEFGLAGNINISSPDTDLAGALAPLPESLLSNRAALADYCAMQDTQTPDSFLITSPGGLPTQPDGWLTAQPLNNDIAPDTATHKPPVHRAIKQHTNTNE